MELDRGRRPTGAAARFLCWAPLLLAACGGHARSPQLSPLPVTDSARVATAQAIALLQLDWQRALAAKDTAFFDSTLTADFLLTGGYEAMSRSEFLQAVRSGSSLPPWTRQEGMLVRVYGDFAVVTGLMWFDVVPDSGPVPARYTEVWARQAGRWRALHGQYSPLPGSSRKPETPAELPRSSQ
jgi:ketosteroid isomerase-like protein